MKKRNVVIGNSSFDTVVMADGHYYEHICGGNAFHAAASASGYSENVAIISEIPANYPQEYLDAYAAHHVDLELVRKEREEILLDEYFIYESNGDRQDCIFHKPTGRKGILTEEEISNLRTTTEQGFTYNDFRDKYPPINSIPSDWNVVSMHLAPSTLECHEHYLLSGQSPIITLDPGRYIKNEPHRKVIELINKATVFMPSKKELLWLYPDMDFMSAIHRLIKETEISLVIKNGPEGSVVYDRSLNKLYKIGTYPAEVVNFTGAGDSIAGALGVFLSDGYPLEQAVRMATVAAAKALEIISADARLGVGQKNILAMAESVDSQQI